MFSSLIVVALTLASQVGDANNRYPFGATGQPGATNANPGGAPSSITPLGNPAAPPANGAMRSSTPGASSGPYAPKPTSNFNTQPTTPAITPSGASSNFGQPQPPPGFSGQSGFTTNGSATSQQPPSKSATMMQSMLAPPRNSQLRGDLVRLVDVISSGRTRNEQTQRIECYWDLCSSIADYYLSIREQEELQAVTSAASRQSAALQEFDKRLSVRSDTALRAARASQFRLASFVGRGPSNLPLPADLPHCGSYSSRYEQVFAGRSSPEAQGLAQLLPLRYAELDDAAIGVTRDEEWLKGVMAHNENSDAAGNLQALDLLALKRRAFVQIARDYNRRIARYSELATPGQISADRLAGMLIRRTGSSAAAPQTRQSSGFGTSTQQTFADVDDWLPAEKPSLPGNAKVDSAVQPASATQSREHSVVVQPQ